MRKKESIGSIKELEILNYRVLKRKSRGDGESVCLCMMEQDSNAVLVAHLNAEGHIMDSQVFIWTENTKDLVLSHARAIFKEIHQNLITHKI
jgi:hypothetical protein